MAWCPILTAALCLLVVRLSFYVFLVPFAAYVDGLLLPSSSLFLSSSLGIAVSTLSLVLRTSSRASLPSAFLPPVLSSCHLLGWHDARSGSAAATSAKRPPSPLRCDSETRLRPESAQHLPSRPLPTGKPRGEAEVTGGAGGGHESSGHRPVSSPLQVRSRPRRPVVAGGHAAGALIDHFFFSSLAKP